MGITTGSGEEQGLVWGRNVLARVFSQVELKAAQLQQGGLGLPLTWREMRTSASLCRLSLRSEPFCAIC